MGIKGRAEKIDAVHIGDKRLKKGFSIIEIVVTLGILAILVIVLGEIFVRQSNLYTTETKASDVFSAHNRSLEHIQNDIRSAKSVAVSKDGYSTDADTLVLELFSVNASGAPLAASDFIIFDRNVQSALFKKVIADSSSARKSSEIILNEFVESILFEYSDPNVIKAKSVTASLVSSASVRGQTKKISDKVEAFLRNK